MVAQVGAENHAEVFQLEGLGGIGAADLAEAQGWVAHRIRAGSLGDAVLRISRSRCTRSR